jgi:hypothetical protein
MVAGIAINGIGRIGRSILIVDGAARSSPPSTQNRRAHFSRELAVDGSLGRGKCLIAKHGGARLSQTPMRSSKRPGNGYGAAILD